MTNNSDKNLDNWQPSERQKNVLLVAKKHKFQQTITDLCKSADISRDTWYEWWNGPFGHWWNEEGNLWIQGHLLAIKSVLMDSAKGANIPGHQDRKMALELLDKTYTPRTKRTIDAKIVADNNSSEELLNKLDTIINDPDSSG